MKFPSLSGLSESALSLMPAVVTRAPVPDDLDAVTTIRGDAEVDPRSVGVTAAAIEEIWAAVLDLYNTGMHPAIQICLRRRGQIIMDRSIGYSHGGGPVHSENERKVLATPDTPFNVFSASKPMAAMAIHLLDERHLVHLDDPVCEYIPEFAAKGKQWVTIRHVLTHRAGIPTPPEEALNLELIEDHSNREAVRLLCEAEPTQRSGGRLAYHAITGGFILGEIVRRVTGRPIRRFVEEEICRPMGWRWMNFGVSRRDEPKIATNYFTGLPLVPPLDSIVKGILGLDFAEVIEASNDARFNMAVLPAANMMATAAEISEFYELLRCGGKLRGVQIFEPRTVWRATSEQSYMEFDFTLGVPLRYSMGFMLGGDWLSLYGADTRHAFGHLGFTNVVSWADPVRELSAAVLNNGKPVLFPEMSLAVALTRTISRVIPKEPMALARAGLNPAAAKVAATQRKARRPRRFGGRERGPVDAPSTALKSSGTREAKTGKAAKAPAKKVGLKKKSPAKKAPAKKAPVKKASSKKASRSKAETQKR